MGKRYSDNPGCPEMHIYFSVNWNLPGIVNEEETTCP